MAMKFPLRTVPIALLGCALIQAQPAPVVQGRGPSDELNRYAPAWLRFSGEYRGRLEGFSGGGFRKGNDDTYFLNRLRINLTIRPAAWLKLYLQAQDSRVFWKTQTPPAPPYQDAMDLRQAYLELGDSEKAMGIRAGRQELNFGNERLVGSTNWSNTARSFDAVRLRLRHKGSRVDVFASTVVQVVNGEFNRPFRAKADNLHGIYGGLEKLIPKAVLEPYVFWRLTRGLLTESGQRGNRDFKTIGLRWAGTLPGNFDYNVEVAAQTGFLGTDRIRAWAGHWQAGYTVSATPWKPRLIAEYNFATGDRNPHDGRRGSFDLMYPTGHDKTGLADQVGWKNIHDIRTGMELHPKPKWLVAPIYHSYWLASATDALYAANGVALAQKADGSAGRRVGQEADISTLYTVNRQMQIGAGFGRLFPGGFLKKATQGRGYSYPYLMLGYTF